MAGESPDRSKQQEPSAEPTRGSTSAVPAPADPRLTVAREATAAAARVDQATAVFSTRALASAEEPATTEAGPAAPAPSPARFAAKPPAEGNERLRAAVAAWVASAEDAPEETPEEAREAAPETAKGASAKGAGEEAPETAKGAAEDAGEDAAEDRAEDSGKAAAEGVDKHADGGSAEGVDKYADGDAAEDAAEGSVQDADEDAAKDVARDLTEDATDGAAEDADDGPAEDAVQDAAEGVTEDADDDAAEDVATGAARNVTEDADDGVTADAAEDEDEPGSDSAEGSSGVDDDGAQDRSEDGAPAESAQDDGPESGPSADSGSSEAPKAEEDSPEGHEGSADAADAADGSEESGSADEPVEPQAADADVDDDVKRVPDPRTTPGTASRTPQSSDLSGRNAEDTTAPEPAESPSGEDSPVDDVSKGVDQPTAVFRTPKRPSVDQPTTTLKVGDKTPAEAKAEPEAEQDAKPDAEPEAKQGAEPDAKQDAKQDAEPDAEPDAGQDAEPDHEKPAPKTESDSERTSKFVALKALDEPQTAPKPPPAPAQGTPRAGAAQTTAIPYVGPERTTQQPLPPRPPLDLLAELTNTPETPVRTLVRRVKIWTPLVILLIVVFATVQTLRPVPEPTLQLTAESSYSFEGGKAEIPWPADGQAALDVQGIGSFGSSGEQKPVPIASVAKVMTAYVILRDHPLKSGADGPKITIDQAAEDQSEAGQESTVKVTAGDKITQREALESILIASANNVARLLARWDAGSENAFVAKMNAAVKDLGMTHTTYTDPSGLNNTTVSTAVDQVKLAKAAMTQPAFREVAAMMSYDDYKGDNHSNWNQLVGRNDVVGIKTGTTTSALGNLVFAAKKDVGGETRTIVGAVVRQPAGGPDNTILGAALDSGDKLIRAAQGALESATILKKGDVVGYVDDGLGGHTPVVADEDVKAVGWAGLKVKLTFAAGDLPRTAKAGTKVGTLTVGDGGTSGAVKVPVSLKQDLTEPGWTDKLTRLG